MLCFFITPPLVTVFLSTFTPENLLLVRLPSNSYIERLRYSCLISSLLLCQLYFVTSRKNSLAVLKAKRKKISRWGNWRNRFHDQMQEAPKLVLLINAAQHRLYNPAFGVAGAGASGKRQNWRAMFRNNPGFNDRLLQTGC